MKKKAKKKTPPKAKNAVKSRRKVGIPTKASGKKATSKIGFAPVGDKVLVKPVPAEEMTSFGIIIPDAAKEKPEQGVVVAVGPGRTEEGRQVPVGVTVGDKIMFNKYGFEEIKINGIEYYLVGENNILGIFN